MDLKIAESYGRGTDLAPALRGVTITAVMIVRYSCLSLVTEQDLTPKHALGFSSILHWVSVIPQADDLSFTWRLAACRIGCVRCA